MKFHIIFKKGSVVYDKTFHSDMPLVVCKSLMEYGYKITSIKKLFKQKDLAI